MNSLHYLQEKLFHFQQKYFKRPRYCAFRMIFSSIYACCFFGISINYKSKLNKYLKKDIPCIVFYLYGGLGDLLIESNYIYAIQQYAEDTPFKIKIYYGNKELLDSVCGLLPDVVELTNKDGKISGSVNVELLRFPRIISGDLDYIKSYSPKLSKLFDSWNTFFTHNRKFFDIMPKIDGLANDYTELLDAKRINQADIGGFLNLGENYIAPIPYPSAGEEQKILEKFGLKDKIFLTINRGQNITSDSKVNNKLWPVEYYNELVAKLKEYYADKFTIVQIGAGKACCNDSFKNIDLNLLGKTNLEELKVILKHAKLHIDSEGGLVHLRHAIKGGRSVVLFGPTSPKIYGYTENLNLRSKACVFPCEWLTDDWLTRCPRRTQKHICMKKLTPEMVFEEIKKLKL